MREKRYQHIDTNFMEFADNRGASFFTQFIMIYKRNMSFLLRNKTAIYGLIVSNIFTALLNISVYWNVAMFPDLISIFVWENKDRYDPTEVNKEV